MTISDTPREETTAVDELNRLLTDMRISLGRMEKTLESIPTMAATLESTRDMARETAQSSKSAHHRIDRIEEGQKWLWRTVATAILGVVVAAVVAVIKMGGTS
jgi:hypothetical protein